MWKDMPNAKEEATLMRRWWAVWTVAVVTLALVSAGVGAQEREQVKAYRNIYFGMTPEQVKEAINSDGAFEPGYLSSIYYTDVGGVRSSVSFDYYDNQLYRVVITGPSNTANGFDTNVKRHVDIFASIIETAYGAPDYRANLRLWDMKDGYVVFSHRWDLDDGKRIRIGISKYDFRYSAKMYIEYMPLVEAKEHAEKAKDQSKIDASVGDF